MRAVAERDVAAVRACDVARDGQPQAGAALILIARIVEPQERLEHLLAHVRRDARPIVVHRDAEIAVVTMTGDGNRPREARGVRHQIAEAALERRRPYRNDRRAMKHHGRLVAVALSVVLELLKKGRHVGRRRALAEIAAREGEIGLQHARHLVDVLLHRLRFRRFLLDQRQFELEAREHRAQVVRDPGQHRRALLDRAFDARLHLDEGLRRAPHLARATRSEIRHFAPFAETFGGVRQAQDRLDLVAQEDDGDADQHQRGTDHPEQEDFRIRRVGGAAPREHPHHFVVELNANLDQRRLADRVDPERPADLLAQFVGQRRIEQAKRTAWDQEAAYRSRAGNRPPGRAGPARCGGSAPCRHPADSRDRRRSERRCRAPRRRTGAR